MRTCYLLVFVLVGFPADSRAANDWTYVANSPGRGRITYNLDEHPLQITTNSTIGSDDQINLKLMYTENAVKLGDIIIKLTNPPTYRLFETDTCTSQDVAFNLSDQASLIKIWTIIKTTTALIIKCDDIEVVNYEYSQSGDDRCEERYANEVTEIQFYDTADTASDAYREKDASCTRPSESWWNLNMETDVTFPVDSGTSVEVTCRPGFVLGGDSTVTCVDDVYYNYETELPYCIGIELVTTGTVFSDHAGDKTLSCGLSEPASWLTQTVTLTFEPTSEDGSISCTTDSTAGTFSCADGVDDGVDDAIALTTIASFSPTAADDPGVSMTVTLAAEVTETTSFRCTVTVGDEDDDQASDTRLVYAQKISVGYSKEKFESIGDEEYITQDEDLTFTIYGDDAYGLLESGSSCAIGVDPADNIAGKSATLTIPAPNSGSTETVTVTCTLKFDDAAETIYTVSVEESLDIAERCSDHQFFDKTATQPSCADCTENDYRDATDSQYVGCRQCDFGQEGYNTSTSETGNDGCQDCPEGQYATGAGVCTSCTAGTYTSSTASKTCSECATGTASNLIGRSTQCVACVNNTYAPGTGYWYCLTCRGTVHNNDNGANTGCTLCDGNENKYYDVVAEGCLSCPDGETYNADSDSCVTCVPGQYSVGSECKDCAIGTHQPAAGQATCIPCEATLGEYQTGTGKSYCNVAAPGHQLKDGTNVADDPEECPKNYYSTGGMAECDECDGDLREYTETTGSTFCSICQGQVINNECTVSTCDEATVTLEGVGDVNFTFPSTASGITATLDCSTAEDADASEKVTRYCRYDSTTGIGSWDSTNSGQCSTEFTAAIEDLAEEINNLNVANTTETDAVTANMSALASNGAANMSAKDYNNIADSLEVLTTNLAASNASVNVSSDTASNLADTVVSVASSGGTKFESVEQEEKDKMVDCLTTVASLLAVDEPVVTDGVAMINLNSIDNGEVVELPTPTGVATAPVLKMNSQPENAPSVAIFDKATAQAIFPTPTQSETETSTTKNTVSEISSIDSPIVSLEFQGATELDFDIAISVNTSGDGSYGSEFVLDRTCKYYSDEVPVGWKTDGCVTTTGIAADGETKFTCSCTHNTSFAIILSATEIADTTQSDVSTVLMSINVIFLFLTFMCIAPFRKFRTRKLMQIQTQLCVSLFAGHVGFLIVGGLSPTDQASACVAGVIIVQYLFLVAMAWSVCASVTLYEKIVNALKSYGKQDKHYFTKCLIGCWFCPLFMVMATWVTAETMSDNQSPYIATTGETDGDSVEACWVDMPWKLVGFMIPVFLCLLLNFFLFVMIARIIIRAGKSGTTTSGHAREIKALVSITFTVGLPWLIILGATIPALAGVFQWLFIIITFLQGPVMFVCYVIFQEDVLTNVFSMFGKQPPKALLPPKSNKSKSAPSEVSSMRTAVTTAAAGCDKRDTVNVKHNTYSTRDDGTNDENIYAKVDEEAAAPNEDSASRTSSKHHYETTAFTQHGQKGSELDPPPVVEQGETYENSAAQHMDIAQSSYPHVPQLV